MRDRYISLNSVRHTVRQCAVLARNKMAYRLTAQSMINPTTASNNGVVRAIQLAQQWAKEGYWGSVYNQVIGECIDEYPPKGHHKDKAASKQ